MCFIKVYQDPGKHGVSGPVPEELPPGAPQPCRPAWTVAAPVDTFFELVPVSLS